MDDIFNNAVKLNWRTLCTDYRLEDGVKDYLSISMDAVFMQPEIFEMSSTVINLQHDFYFEKASIQDALLNLANVLFEFLEKLDREYSRLKLIPLGFYELGSSEALFTMRDISDQLFSISGLKEMLMEQLEKGKSIVLKVIAVEEKGADVNFRLFQISINVFLVENS